MTTEQRLAALEKAVAGLLELAELQGDQIDRMRDELGWAQTDAAIADMQLERLGQSALRVVRVR